MRLRVCLTFAAATWLMTMVGVGQLKITPTALRNHPAIGYQTVTPQDAVARLNERLRQGEVHLEFEPTRGYLKSTLSALTVPEDSQLLVFSKTSFQARKINPDNPRALFFNDTVSIGWVRGGEVLEAVAQDPRQGAIFYTLEQRPAATPQFVRDLTCVQCHTFDGTLDVPGMFTASVFPSTDGSVIYAPAFSVDHRTPFELRWGGWYVTGRHMLPRHFGNATVPPDGAFDDMITPATVHTTSLTERFDPTGYLSLQSDLVALMVFEHQARMLNLITRVGWEARLGREAGRPLGDAVAELVDYLLFIDEAPLPGPVMASTFAKTFSTAGPRDSKGRSLRDLDLQTRLMRVPCSYLIYSAPFDALPDSAKQEIYARLWHILSGAATEPRYGRLSADDRQAVIDILRDTKPGLPVYFNTVPPTSSPGNAEVRRWTTQG